MKEISRDGSALVNETPAKHIVIKSYCTNVACAVVDDQQNTAPRSDARKVNIIQDAHLATGGIVRAINKRPLGWPVRWMIPQLQRAKKCYGSPGAAWDFGRNL